MARHLRVIAVSAFLLGVTALTGCDKMAWGSVTYRADERTLACTRALAVPGTTSREEFEGGAWLEFAEQPRPGYAIRIGWREPGIAWEWNLNIQPDPAAVRRVVLHVESILKLAHDMCGLDLQTVRCDHRRNEQERCPWMRPL